MILRSIFIVLSSIPLFARAEFQTNLELLSFLSWTQTNQGSLSLIQYRNDASFYISGNFKYIRSGFTTEIRPEIRTLFSEGLDLDPSDTSYATIEPHSRHFNWQQSLKKNYKPETYTDIDKFVVSYSGKFLELYFGRKEVGLGLVPYLSVWNKFDVALPTTIRADKSMTHDGFGGTWQKSNLSARLIGVVGPTRESNSYLGIGSWYSQSSGVEIHFLGGTLWEESAFGNAFALDWRGWNVRAETLWIGQINTRGESGFQSSASAEYSFASVWTVDFEYLNIESRFLDDRKVSRYSPLIGHNYLFGIISRQLWETIKVSMGSLYSLTDESLLGILKLRYSFSDHGETQFEVKSPFGKTESEFSNKRVLLPDGSYAGFPLFVSLNTKFVF